MSNIEQIGKVVPIEAARNSRTYAERLLDEFLIIIDIKEEAVRLERFAIWTFKVKEYKKATSSNGKYQP